MTYRLAELPLRPPADGLGDMPELLDPLGWRTRVPLEESEGVAEPFRGKVLEDPGRFREADESGRWKLGVRRTDIGVFGPVPPSKTC